MSLEVEFIEETRLDENLNKYTISRCHQIIRIDGVQATFLWNKYLNSLHASQYRMIPLMKLAASGCSV